MIVFCVYATVVDFELVGICFGGIYAAVEKTTSVSKNLVLNAIYDMRINRAEKSLYVVEAPSDPSLSFGIKLIFLSQHLLTI